MIMMLPEAICAPTPARNDPTTRSFIGQAICSPVPWLAIGLAAVVALFADVVGPRAADHVTVADLYREQASALLPSARDDPLAQWSFPGELAKDWTPTDGVALANGGEAVEVTTTTGRSDYQLTGPTVLLSPGTYELRADVAVSDGGIELGVLDADKNAWLNTSRYWSGQQGFGSRDLVVAVRAVEATPRASRSSRTGSSAQHRPRGASAGSGSDEHDAESSAGRLSRLVMREPTDYKKAAIEQWTADPCGASVAGGEPGSGDVLRSSARLRHDYAPWMPEALGYDGAAGPRRARRRLRPGIDLARYAQAGARRPGST